MNMDAISPNTLTFLNALKLNNNKEWFTENKENFEIAKADFESFIAALIAEISKFDPAISHLSAKECIFRIYRDVRFSKDKSPYKTHFGAHISPVSTKTDIHSSSGYYLHLEPGNATMLAGGAYLPESNWLKRIRQEIDYNGQDLVDILKNDSFKKYFGELEGEKLKRMPKGFDENHPNIELLKMKSFLASHKVNDSDITRLDFLEKTVNVFKSLKPLGDFLNRE